MPQPFSNTGLLPSPHILLSCTPESKPDPWQVARKRHVGLHSPATLIEHSSHSNWTTYSAPLHCSCNMRAPRGCAFMSSPSPCHWHVQCHLSYVHHKPPSLNYYFHAAETSHEQRGLLGVTGPHLPPSTPNDGTPVCRSAQLTHQASAACGALPSQATSAPNSSPAPRPFLFKEILQAKEKRSTAYTWPPTSLLP